jgi:hypothetical protein
LRILDTKEGSFFLDIYTKTEIPDPNKDQIIALLRKSFKISMENIRIYIAYIDDVPLA